LRSKIEVSYLIWYIYVSLHSITLSLFIHHSSSYFWDDVLGVITCCCYFSPWVMTLNYWIIGINIIYRVCPLSFFNFICLVHNKASMVAATTCIMKIDYDRLCYGFPLSHLIKPSKYLKDGHFKLFGNVLFSQYFSWNWYFALLRFDCKRVALGGLNSFWSFF
jgi:hypothetical protein